MLNRRLGGLTLIRLFRTGTIMGKVKQQSAKPTISTKPEPKVDEAIGMNKDGQIVLRIHAKPGAKKSMITDVSPEEIGVAIGAPPRDGAANEELIGFLQQTLGLRKNELDFDKGAKCRSKVILVTTQRFSLEEVKNKIISEIGK